jgi:glycosyltransferase involved in cell wall biosynthesis
MYEHAMLICLSTGNRDGLQQLTNDEQMPEAQSVYGRALLAIYDDNWEGALAELRREPWFSPPQARLTALRAFCALSTNSPRLANETLARLDLSVGRPGRQATYWLRAMIALRLQDEETVRRNIEALLERPVTGAEELTLDFLLKYWDESPNSWHGVTVAFVFPKLPPSITRLDKAIVRPPYGGPILPKVTEVLSATQDEREARRTGPVVLCVATEWHSAHGGLSTFNRQLAIAIARTGSIVYCYVPHCSHDEIEAAQSVGVTLIASPDRANSSDAARLRRRPPLHPNFEPNVIIGHDRITGAEAQALTSDFFPNSKNVLFIHTAPREIEWYKEPDPTETSTGAADERARFQKELALKADVVAAVGPKLFAAIQTELVGESRQPLLARIDPGMVVSHDIPEEPQIVNCLLLGRAEDDSLKGLDIAARAMGILRSRFEATGSRKPTLVVRGAVTASGDTLRHQLLAISRNPQLHIDIRPFTATSAQIISEIKSTWALLMPSRSEGFGLVALEAIGVGAPVLVGEQSGIATLLRAECPDLADNAIVAYHGELEKDANEWANRIEFVLRDRAAALVRATELRDRLAPKLSWDRAAAELFASLVKTDQHSAGT